MKITIHDFFDGFLWYFIPVSILIIFYMVFMCNVLSCSNNCQLDDNEWIVYEDQEYSLTIEPNNNRNDYIKMSWNVRVYTKTDNHWTVVSDDICETSLLEDSIDEHLRYIKSLEE